MRKTGWMLSVLAALLIASNAVAGAQFKILAPAEECFIGMDQLLIIGKVEGLNQAKMVEISNNGKPMGFVPLQKGSFVFKTTLGSGRHEITLTAPGVERKSIRVFVGKQKGYQYHTQLDLAYCANCHKDAASKEYGVSFMQTDLCEKCHDPMGTKEYVHGPVAAGSCTPCHDPHGSRYDDLLVAVGKELCLACHSQNLSMKHIQERANADCTKCHDPHSSAKEYHLR